MLTGHPGAAGRVRRARLGAAGNPIAAAIVSRAAALAGGDHGELLAAAAALSAAGCRYQWARTLIFAGGQERDRGQAAMAGMGATDMGTGTDIRGLPDEAGRGRDLPGSAQRRTPMASRYSPGASTVPSSARLNCLATSARSAANWALAPSSSVPASRVMGP